jgi:hypothetical protein
MINVYRLDPIEANKNSPHWLLSSVGSSACWVAAEDEDTARELVTRATVQACRATLGNDSPLQPWMHRDLAECTLDTAKGVPIGVVVVADGQRIDIEN